MSVGRVKSKAGRKLSPRGTEIVRYLSLLLIPGEPFEVRTCKPRAKSRFFANSEIELQHAAEYILAVEAEAPAVYVTLNPVRAGLKKAAADVDVTRRIRLLLDFDPTRDGEASATEEEKGAARAIRDATLAFLVEQGWPDPLEGDSGNGYHAIHGCDLPNDVESRDLVKQLLARLNARFGTAAASIDTKVFNASRIVKVLGTWARKGPDTPQRPHRLSRLTKAPDELDPVSVETIRATLETLAADLEAESDQKPDGIRTNGTHKADPWTMTATSWTPEQRAAEWLKKCDPAISGQRGHDKLLWAAGVGPKFDLLPEVTLLLLGEIYNPICQPPWSEQELRHKVEEAYRLNPNRGELRDEPRNGMGKWKSGNSKPPGSNGEAAIEEPRRRLSNFEAETIPGKEGQPEKIHKRPLGIADIAASLTECTHGWPKSVQGSLFLQRDDYRPLQLDSATRLFAWIDRIMGVDWSKGGQFVTQERFYEHLRMTTEEYEAIETQPHWPPLPGIYYMHPGIPARGNLFNQLLDRFCPASPVDRELIRAMILTMFWGGSPGTRPAFIVTAAEDDPQQGRGTGKSTTTAVLAEELAGEYVDVSPNETIADIKIRLLSAEGRQKRVVRLDNVKTHRFSWADLEGFITGPVISGRELYQGEGRRPNTLVWVITLNGASLSKDMAQRVIPIHLARPEYRADWEEEVRSFIRKNRLALLGDIRDALCDEPGIVVPRTRWAAWERHVLSKTDDLTGCQDAIVERQGDIDDDNDERDLVAAFFREQLETFKQDPETCCVFIPSGLLAQWLSDATRQTWPTNKASAHIRGLGIPELRKSAKQGQKGWVWTGQRAARDAVARRLHEDHQSEPWRMTSEGSRAY